MATTKAAISIQQMYRRNRLWWFRTCINAGSTCFDSIWESSLYTPIDMGRIKHMMDKYFVVLNRHKYGNVLRAKAYAFTAHLISGTILHGAKHYTECEDWSFDLSYLHYAYEIAFTLHHVAKQVFNGTIPSIATPWIRLAELHSDKANSAIVNTYYEDNDQQPQNLLVYLRRDWNKAATTIQHWFRRTRN